MTDLTLMQALALGLFAFSALMLCVCGAYLIAQEIVEMAGRGCQPDDFDARWKRLCDVEHKGHGND